jgi:hypothetical protein
MKSQMARWLEAETYRLKIMGMSFQEIFWRSGLLRR